MNRVLSAHFALFGANLIYGLNYTIAKDVMPAYILPFGFIFCRVTGSLFLFWLLHMMFYRERIERKDIPLLAICGLFGVAINQLLFFKGLDITTPINASIIMTTNPILVLVIAAMVLKERISISRTIGIVLGISGAITLITFKRSYEFGGEGWTGDIMIFVNSVSYALFLVLAKPLMEKYKPITVIKWVFIFGYLIVIPFGFGEFTMIKWTEMSHVVLWEVVFVIFASTFLAYLLNIYSLKIISPAVSSSYIYLQPVIAGIVALWAGKDEVSLVKIIAAIMIFAGVFMVSRAGTNKI